MADYTQTRQTQLMNAIAASLDEILTRASGRRVGFCVLVYPLPDDPERNIALKQGANYVSNGSTDDMIAFLRLTANRIEKKQTIGIPIGEA